MKIFQHHGSPELTPAEERASRLLSEVIAGSFEKANKPLNCIMLRGWYSEPSPLPDLALMIAKLRWPVIVAPLGLGDNPESPIIYAMAAPLRNN